MNKFKIKQELTINGIIEIFEEKSPLSMEVNISQNYCKEPYVEVTLEEALDGALLKVSRLAEQLAKEFTNQNDTNDNKKKK